MLLRILLENFILKAWLNYWDGSDNSKILICEYGHFGLQFRLYDLLDSRSSFLSSRRYVFKKSQLLIDLLYSLFSLYGFVQRYTVFNKNEFGSANDFFYHLTEFELNWITLNKLNIMIWWMFCLKILKQLSAWHSENQHVMEITYWVIWIEKCLQFRHLEFSASFDLIEVQSDNLKTTFALLNSFSLKTFIFEPNCMLITDFKACRWEIDTY